MRLLIFLPFMALFLAQCKRQPLEQPTRTEVQMARIMADLAIADAATNGLNGYPKDSLAQIYFRQVLEMHQLSMEEHEKNLRLYANDLGQLDRILQQAELLVDVNKRIEAEKAQSGGGGQ
jgi:hypothetical protein